MNVCVLEPSYRGSDSVIRDLDVARDLGPLLPGHSVAHVWLEKASAVSRLRALDAEVFVNLCDGAWDEDTPGIEVVRALERAHRAFTGAGSSFYDPTRRAMKLACLEHDIPTPAFVFAADLAAVEQAARELEPPWFVKPEHGYNSVGITEASRVETRAVLHAQAARTIAEFGGALIEEYKGGRELSVLVASDPGDERLPTSFRPVECVFPEGVEFKTFDHKWRGPRNPWKRCDDALLAGRLEEMSRDLFAALGGDGYARADIRVDARGRPFLLELNPNCSLFYADDDGSTADVILAADGTGKARFLARMIEFARARRERDDPVAEVRLDPGRGYGLHARRAIAAGARIVRFEQERHVLVTRARVERAWSPPARDTFRRYAYALTEAVYVLWDEDPARWRPINHSCDPNAWVTGLDLEARRPIAAGEEITFDYATLATGADAEFPCACGATLCRGAFRAADHLAPWLAARYGDHVTSHVRASRRRAHDAASAAAAAAGAHPGGA